LFGATEERAVFRQRSSDLTPYGRDLVSRLARCLAGSRSAQGLAGIGAILSVTIEGHTGEEGFQSAEQSWNVSVQRALKVRQILESVGRRSETSRADSPAQAGSG